MDETPEREGLHSIGKLSKSMAVSTDTLRYYDEIELLKPAYISAETGYRYYSAAQAAALTQIIELKTYGFSLAEVKKIIARPGASLREIYQNRYWELLQEKKKLQAVIDKISEKIKWGQERIFMNKKLLLVDDAAFMRMMLRDILTKNGYEVVGEAANGTEAAEKYKTFLPDLVVMDIVMPECDGICALQKIREYAPEANAVMVSAMSQAHIVAESLLAGAHYFVAKPFLAETLVKAIQNAFTETAVYEQRVLETIRERCVGRINDILSQAEIDEIINTARYGIDDSQLEGLIGRLRHSRPEDADAPVNTAANAVGEENAVTLKGLDENMRQSMQVLNKIAQGQAEIISLLKDMRNA